MKGPSAAPMLTVITATFNLVKGGREQAFRQCAESVHSQTCAARIEHLVIDGGSADGTRELVAEYESAGLLRCISEPDEGIFDAMNKGLAAAKGKYIAFLNSDDYWHDPQGAERSLAVLELAHGDFSYAPVTLLHENGRRELQEPQIGGAFSNIPLCHQTMIARTDLLRSMGGFRKELFCAAADYDLTLRMLLQGAKAVYVPLNFTTFRMGGFSSEAALWKQDVAKAQRMALEPVFGAETTENICASLFDVTALRTLSGLLHPTVYAELQRLLKPVQETPRYLHALNDMGREVMDKQVRGLFDIPLWRERRVGDTVRIYCFGIPLLATSYTSGKTVCRLFGILPLWGWNYNNYGSVTFCVLGVPVCGVKWKRRRR